MNASSNISPKCLFFSALFGISVLSCLPHNLYSQENNALAAREIIKNSDDLMRGNSLKGVYRMSVITPDWERSLVLEATTKERDRTFIRITSPAKEAGIRTLRIGNNMWNYLPNVERTIKIPPSLMLQSWMGSDFTNDDLVKESSIVDDYTHTIIGEDIIETLPAHKIELLPKPNAPVTWGKIIYWISKEGFIPLKEEFYSEDTRLIKVLEYSAPRKFSDRVIPSVWKMTSMIKNGHSTIIEVMEAVYDQPVEDIEFTMSALTS